MTEKQQPRTVTLRDWRMANGPDKNAIAILDRARDKVNSMAAWNTLFDAQVYLVNRAEYRHAPGTGTLADREDAS